MSSTRAVEVSIHAVVPVSVHASSAANTIPAAQIHMNIPKPDAYKAFFINFLHIFNFHLNH
jgi:hypothetical protein